METPSSTRRITRSQSKASNNGATSNTKFSRKMDDSEKKKVSESRQRTGKQERSPLIDISNDSPIVGLASGSFMGTPLSSVSKQRSNNCCKKTPGSGEALLRGQVKNLLQKVEEEAEISKFSIPIRHGFKAIFNSPRALVAPTPVNTPQILNFSVEDFDSFTSFSESPIQDQLNVPQVMNGIIDDKKQAGSSSETENDEMIKRALFLEFSEKSDSSSECSSVVTYQETYGVKKMASMEDDDASIWSIQANASTQDEEEEDEDEVNQNGADDEEYYHDDDEEEEDIPDLDELCEGISNISVDGEKKKGKHIRFVYNSDDELVEECEENVDILRLKGLPTPKGKHVRFQGEDEDLIIL